MTEVQRLIALKDLYDEKGVQQWLAMWRAADEDERVRMDRWLTAMVDGTYI